MNGLIPYCGPPPEPSSVFAAWNLGPLPMLLVLLLLLGGFYQRWHGRIEPAQRAALGLAIAGLVIAFISPLCALTVALFSARTLHHLLLISIAAPALAFAFPKLRLLKGNAALALGVVSAVLWAWHIPAVYTAAWESHFVYWMLQIALLGSAWAFWSAILHRQDDSPGIGGAALIAGLSGQMGLIGAILTFSPRVLYSEHILLTDAFGLTGIGDQQLAGLIMWVPGMLPLACLAALILRRRWQEVSAA